MEIKDIQINAESISGSIKGNNIEENKNNDYDYIEECIGAIGLWQICVSLTAVLTRYIALGNFLTFVFLIPATDFVCVEFMDNVTTALENNTCYEDCVKYLYHSDVMDTSLISDFELICEKNWLASFTQTTLMFGVLIGGITFGWFSDRYGRRKALIVSTFLNVISMVPTSFVSNYWIFCSLRFVTGVASSGSLMLSIPLVMEIIGKRYREYAGVFIMLPDGFAEAIQALFAYLLPTWDAYLLGTSVMTILIFLLICFVPESPRWLISQGKIDQALIIINKAATMNNLNTDHINETVLKNVNMRKINESKNITTSYLDLFTNKSILIITISTSVVWCVFGMTFYGIYQYLTFLESSVHNTVIIFGLIQVPLCILEYVMTKIFQRRISLIASLLITAFTMVGIIFTPQGHLTTFLLEIIGFSSVNYTCFIAYIYQSELYPTPIRNMSFGLTTSIGRIGAMIAPFVSTLSPTWVPLSIFAIVSFLAASFCCVLPETKGTNLKDNIE